MIVHTYGNYIETTTKCMRISTIVAGVEEITPAQSSLSLTTLLKLFIPDHGFGLIGPRQVHAEYKMHTYKTIYNTFF